MAVTSVLLITVFVLFGQSLQADPYMDPTLTYTLYEDEADDHIIDCPPCVHPNPVTVSILGVSVAEGIPHCTTCFYLNPISPTSGECLFYKRNALVSPAEKLDFNYAKRYLITLECRSGVDVTQVDLDIRIRPNVAPHFTGTFLTGPLTATCPTDIDAALPSGIDVYTALTADDANSDTVIYSMTSHPPNDVFDINPGTGHIHTVKPVSGFCYRTVEFHVYISDNKLPPTGPLVITCSITNYNKEVMVSNGNRDVWVDEDKPVGGVAFTMRTPTNPLPVTYTIINVFPPSGTSPFGISGADLVVASPLNFEDFMNRNLNITITADNGQCQSEEFWLHLHLVDKNDPPVPSTTSFTHTTPEGAIISFNLDAAFIVADEDNIDFKFNYKIIGANPFNMWAVGATNELTSVIPYDLETHGASTTLTLEITDSKGAAASVTVTVAATDINDNPPIFANTAYSFTVSDCTAAGTSLGQLVATDADTGLSNNNAILFDVVLANGISVDANGNVRLLTPVTVGSTPSVKVGARDQGIPVMTSPWQADVSLIVTPCGATDSTQDDQCGDSNAPISFYLQVAAFIAALVENSG